MSALHVIIDTPLYKNIEVNIHPQWNSMFALSQQTQNANVAENVDNTHEDNNTNNQSCETNNEDGFEEQHENVTTDTMVQNLLSSEQIYDYFEKTIVVAPGQDSKPLGLFHDECSEELNFPTLFFGQPRYKGNIKLSYQKLAQWELLHKNHNFAISIPNLFFKAIKVLIHGVMASSWIRIRKGKLLHRTLQAKDVMEKPNLDNILKSDIGYMDLSKLRTSPDYLSQLRKNVFAMIRQLGPPTFFVTFTSAESKWPPLLKCLYDLNYKKLALNVSFDKLESKHIVDLIRCDLVTCACYYHHRMNSF